jgi:predicted MPP superfamily phosphohydrolase
MGGLQFAGIGDLWSPEFGAETRAALDTLTPGQPTVVLAHNPDAQDEPIWDGVRGWVLAGHTHGGQVKPPFLPPPILPVRNKRYSSGRFEVGPGRTLYINRGLGHLQQVRFNARPELTLFTLVRAASDATS